MHDLVAPSLQTSPIFTRYAAVVAELQSVHRDLALALVAELQARTHGWVNSPETSATGRERDASAQAASFTAEVLNVKGEVAALECERDFLLTCITYNIVDFSCR